MGFHKLLPSSVFTYFYRELTEIAIFKSKLFPNTLSYDIPCRCWSRTVYVCLWKMYGGYSLHIICWLGAVYLQFWTKIFYFWLIPFITHCQVLGLTKVKISPWPNRLFSHLHTYFFFFTLWKFAGFLNILSFFFINVYVYQRTPQTILKYMIFNVFLKQHLNKGGSVYSAF